MSALRQAIDTTTLGWIKPELDETLRQARHEIEAFAEGTETEASGDAAGMRACAGFLHQVLGTLRMVELYAPALVAEEMERLASALAEGAVPDRDDACAALMRGVVLLPDYLERLQGGHKDIPVVLLPLLNELRAARGESALAESALFQPDLDRPLPAGVGATTQLRRQDRQAQSAPLLDELDNVVASWTDAGPADPAALAHATAGLLGAAEHEATRRMLWVAASVAAAVRDGAMPASSSLRDGFAGVARASRRMFDYTLSDVGGFSAPAAEPTFAPTRQLLYHVADGTARHEALDPLRETFDLQQQVPSEAELAHARGSLSGRNRALLDTVSAAIKEDLLRVKDTLDLHLRTQEAGVADLEPQVEALGRVADTLGMMGLDIARNVVLQQRDAMHEMVYGNREADEGALLDIAGALLYVDASLDDQVARLGLPTEKADKDQFASESRKVLDVVVREAIANFGDARQAFVAFVETGWHHGELVEVPRLLDEVAGAMRILDLARPAGYLAGVRMYAETELLSRKRVPASQQLDTLADALASLEYYLEALRDQRPHRDEILDIAGNSLEALGYWPLPEIRDVPPSMAAPEPAAEVEQAPAPQPVTHHAATATGNAGGFESSDDIDDEIREVFLEEFEEEIANLGQLLVAWRAAPDEMERLRPIRRVFHTLKGSGRLVGARTLGEFSWKVENMLNRVLDGTRPPTPAVIALAGVAHDTLPELHAALRGDAVIGTDLGGIEAVADRIAAGEEAFYSAPAAAHETPVDAAGEVVAEPQPEPEGVVASVDPVLLEILDTEVAGHLETLEGWLGRAGNAPTHADDALLRAIHTMNGAFAMTEVPSITDVTTPAEAYVRRLLAARQVADADGVSAIRDVVGAIRGTIDALKSPSPRVPLFTALAARMAALRDSLPEAQQPVFAVEPIEAEPVEAASETLDAVGLEAGEIEEADLAALDLSAFTDMAEDLPAEEAIPEALAPQVDADDLVLETFADAVVDDDGEAARLEAERAEAEAAEASHREAALLEAERIEAERLEAGRIESERTESERLKAEEEAEYARLEAEYAEQARLEQARLEQEQAEAAARAVAEREAAERAEAERAEAERAEAERAEAARAEAERVEAERAQAERAEVERAEAERAEAERAEAERAEAERAEAARTEAARVDTIEPAVAAAIANAVALASEDPDEILDLTGLDPELVDIFVEEGSDLLDHSDGLLAQLRDTPGAREPVVGLQRDLHTLKGGARMAGIMAVGELGHAMESLLEAVAEGKRELGGDGIVLLEQGFDRLHAMVTRVGDRRAVAMPDALIAEFDARARGQSVPRAADGSVAAPSKPSLKPLSAPIVEAGPDDEDLAVRAPQEQVRIRADLLDRLVNYAGEVAIYRARLEQQLGAFRGAMGEMEQTNARLRDQLRRLDIETEAQIIARYQREHEASDQTFDPLELDRFSTLQQLSRALAESATDLSSLQGSLDDLTRQYETLLLQQSRVSSDLQEGLMRTRMVPFEGLVPRLRRVVRQAASETGKQAQLKLDGAAGELDRNVLDHMTAPLEHLLRNAVAHGIEDAAVRKKAGKPEEGTVRIALRREGSEVVLEVADDGAGLDRAGIRKRAIERNLVRADAVLADGDLDALILEQGFSTADTVSRLAGRGVGMDVVHSEVRQLGGTLDIASTPGQGVRFTLRLPQTLAVTQAAFVQIGETTFAVPIASVRGVGRISRDELEVAGATYRYGGEDYALHDLGQLVGHAPAKAEGHLQMPLLLIRS
ncbi:MAG TPA: Hpt domain-containing protein, partial [Xanthomonadaceae bacterium]|nr:Hpt domain-containing protein [Xanthomonadaceae bacterium]